MPERDGESPLRVVPAYASDMTTPSSAIGPDFMAKAAEVASKLRPGTYEAAQALATVSIAASLVRIADALERREL